METRETLINVARVGGEMCMREKVIKELNSCHWWGHDSDTKETVDFIINLVKAIELTKVEQ